MPDRDRALTAEGKRKLREVLRVARRAGVSPGLILTSPYKRARETAAIAADSLGYPGDIIETENLVPSGEPREVWAEIRALRHDQILLASHEPLCGRLAAFLLGSMALGIDYKKGALARFDVISTGPMPRAVLHWLLTARLAEPAR
jgi:phosphohistidine phosphatase SixA